MLTHSRSLALVLTLCLLIGLLAGCSGSTGTAETPSAPAETAAAPAETAAETAQEATPAEEPAPAAEEAAPAAEEPAPAEEAAPAAEEPAPAGEEPAPAEGPQVEVEVEAEAASSTGLEPIVRTYTQAEVMPLTEDRITLTAWDYVVPPVMSVISDYGVDGQVYAELQRRSGINFDFTTANLLTASENMSLMIAADNLPDIIYDFGMFNTYSVDDLVGDEMIVNFREYEDLMPNYFDILYNNPAIIRALLTESGYIGYCANIQDTLIPSAGPAIRQEWLDADGLDVPVTIADVDEVLHAFQVQNNCQYPLFVSNLGVCSLSSAYGVNVGGQSSLGGWNYTNGEMEYCLPMEGFKQYVQLIADWYAEGLINPDFISSSNDSANPQVGDVINNGCGFFTSSVMGLTDYASYEPESNIQPIQRIVLNEGDLITSDDAGTNRVSKGGAAVACSNPELELSLQLMDYGYSDEGVLLWNYGVEGVSFEYDEEGEPKLTELVTNNPDGIAFSAALIKYTCATPASICINERNFQGYNDAQLKALTVWLRNGESEEAPGSLWTAEDQTEYSNLSTDLGSFVTTAVLQFMTGNRPMSEWDGFVDQVMSSFDIDRMKELSEAAVQRYMDLYQE